MEDVTKIVTISDATTAYNLELGFVPDYVEVRNVTQWAADSKKVFFYWYKDQGDGYYAGMENLSTVATNGQKPIAGTSNGFTAYNSGSFAARSVLIDTGSSKITQATEAVVTSTGHGLSTGDKVTFQSITAGMTEINGLSTEVTYLTADTFSCDNIDSTGFTAWNSSLATGQFVKTSDLVQDAGKKGITLGTDILATNADVLIVRAVGEGNYSQVTQA
jgi:hypothetical protein